MDTKQFEKTLEIFIDTLFDANKEEDVFSLRPEGTGSLFLPKDITRQFILMNYKTIKAKFIVCDIGVKVSISIDCTGKHYKATLKTPYDNATISLRSFNM